MIRYFTSAFRHLICKQRFRVVEVIGRCFGTWEVNSVLRFESVCVCAKKWDPRQDAKHSQLSAVCFVYGKRRMTGNGSFWQRGIDLLQPTHLQNMLLADRGLKPSEKTPPATSKVMNFHKTRINVYKYLRSRYRKLDIIKFSLRIHYSFHTHTQLEFYNKILSWLRHVKACIQQMSILQ